MCGCLLFLFRRSIAIVHVPSGIVTHRSMHIIHTLSSQHASSNKQERAQDAEESPQQEGTTKERSQEPHRKGKETEALEDASRHQRMDTTGETFMRFLLSIRV